MPLAALEKEKLKQLIDADAPLPDEYCEILFPGRGDDHYRRLYEDAPVGLFQLQLEGLKPLALSRQLLEITGHASLEQLVAEAQAGRLIHDPQDRERLYTALAAQSEVHNFDVRINRPNGATVWIRLNGRLNQAAGVFEAAVYDVTAEKESQQQIEQMSEMLDTAPSAIMVVALDGRIRYANQRASAMHGYSREEFLELSLQELDSPANRSLTSGRISDVVRHGQAMFEVEHCRKDGSLIPLEAHVRLIEWYGQEALLSVETDITDRRAAEQALAAEQHLLQSLIEIVPDMVYFKDTQSRFIRINPAEAELLGLTNVNDALGLTDRDFFEPEHAAIAREDELTIMRTGQSLAAKPEHIKGGDGKYRWLMATKMPLRDAAGAVIGTFGVSHDVTELKLREEALAASEERYRAYIALSSEAIACVDFTEPIPASLPADEFIEAAYARGHLAECNAAFAAPYPQATPESLRGTPLIGILDPANPVNHTLLHRMVQANFNIVDVESSYTTPEGVTKHYANNIFAVIEAGLIKRIWVTSRDITERRQADLALQELNQRLSALITELQHANQELQHANAELNLAQAAQQENEKRIRDLANNLPGIVFQFYAHHDGEWGLHYVSDRAPELLGLSTDLAGFFERFTVGIPAEEHERFMTSIRDAIQQVKPWEYEGRYCKSGTEEIWFSGIAQPETAADGLIYNGVILDITARKLAEQELQASEAQFRRVMEHYPDTIYRFDLEHRYLYINKALGVGIDQPLNFYLGRTPEEAGFPADECRYWREQGERAIASKQILRGVAEVDGPTGLGYIEWCMVPELDQHGEVYAVTSIERDITETRRAAAEVESLSRFPRENPNPVLRATLTGELLYANPGSTRILDYWGVAVGQTLPAGMVSLIQQAMSCGKNLEHDLDCAETAYSLVIAPVVEHGYVNLYGRDITERKQAERDLAALNEQLSATNEELVATNCELADANHELLITQQALQEATQYSETLIQTASTMIVGLDYQGRVEFCNPAALEILGYSSDELTGRDWCSTVLPPEDRAQVQQVFQAWQQGQAPLPGRYVNAVLTKPGVRRLIEWQNSEIALQGSTVGTVSFGIDITERHQAEQALRDSEERLRLALQSTNQGLYDLNVQTGFSTVTPEYVTMLGYAPDEFDSSISAWATRLHPDDQPRVAELYRQCVAGDIPGYSTEYRLKTKTHDWKWVLSIGKVIEWDEHGRPLRMVGTHTDISAAKRAEEQLRFQALVLDQIGDTVTATDLEGRITFVNQAQCRAVGKPRSQLLGQTVLAYGEDPNLGATQQEIIRETIAMGQWRGEIVNYDAAGNPRFVDVRTWVINDDTGVPLGMCGVGTDITDSRQAQQALRDSEERYRRLFQVESDALFLLDQETGRILEVNDAAVELYGYSREQLLLMSNHELPADPASSQPGAATLGAPTPVCLHRKRDGTEFPVEITTSRFTWHGRASELAAIRDITERIKDEAEILRTQAQQRAILENIPYMAWLKDTEGRFLQVNQRFAAACGKQIPEIIGFTDVEIWPAEQALKYQADDSRVMQQKQALIVEEIISGSTGLSWHETIKTPVFDDQGQIIGTTGLSRDITERKAAHEALRANEEFLRAVVDNSPLGISVRTAQGRLVSYNQSWQRIWAMGDEAVKEDLNRVRRDLILDQRDDYLQPWWRQLSTLYREGGTLFIPEVRTSGARPGAAEWVSQYFYAIPDAQGQVERVVVITQDITSRKQAEEALQQKTEELDRFFSLALDLLVIADTDGYFRRLNPAWQETLGYRLADLEGCRFLDLVHADDLERTLKAVSELSAGKSVIDFTNRYRCKDGTYRWIEWRSMPYQEKLIYAAARDVTERISAEDERQHLEAQLRQAQKMEAIGTLAGGIAHDFNNLLFAILGNAELIQEDLRAGSQSSENMARLLAAGNRAKGLVQQILAFSRKSAPGASQLSLSPIVKEVAKLLTATLPSTIEVRQSFEPLHSLVEADPTELHQVVLNLCTNASQAMEGRPGILELGLRQVEVDAEFASRHLALQPGRYVELIVSDSGPGIAAEFKDRIFEPFFTTKEPGKGTGMGLAVVHGIVTKLGGSISVYSEPGVGTAFHVYLPAVPGEEPAAPASAEPIQAGSGHVLLVDDEPDIVDVMRQMLRSMGYDVTALYSSLEALALFRQDPARFDMLITDQTMPKLPGSDLAQAVLAIRPDFPIVLCTGFSQNFSPEVAAASGIREYLFKPVLKHDLAAALQRLQERPAPDGTVPPPED